MLIITSSLGSGPSQLPASTGTGMSWRKGRARICGNLETKLHAPSEIHRLSLWPASRSMGARPTVLLAFPSSCAAREPAAAASSTNSAQASCAPKTLELEFELETRI